MPLLLAMTMLTLFFCFLPSSLFWHSIPLPFSFPSFAFFPGFLVIEEGTEGETGGGGAGLEALIDTIVDVVDEVERRLALCGE